MSFNIPFITSDSVKSKIDSNSLSHGSVTDCFDKSKKDLDSLMVEKLDKDELPEKNRIIFKSNATQTFISPSIVHEQPRRTKRSLHKEEELHVLALSEAQMKVDIAAMLKEEARIKLEEAHYRKEEARLRMLLFTYKLDRIKEDWLERIKWIYLRTLRAMALFTSFFTVIKRKGGDTVRLNINERYSISVISVY